VVRLGELPEETARRLPRYPNVPATLVVDAKDEAARRFYRSYERLVTAAS